MKAFFPFLPGSLSPSELLTHDIEFHTRHWLRWDLIKSKMWMFGIKDYGSCYTDLAAFQFYPPSTPAGSSLMCLTPERRRASHQAHPSIALLQRLYWAQAHCLCQQAASLRSPLISLCMQMRMMMKKQPAGTLQHSRDQLSKHGSLPVWQICNRVPQGKGFVTTWPK